MKKKFINGLLLIALFVGVTGSMVSCKDYDDEKIGNLEAILANSETTLRNALATQKAELQAQIDALKTQIAGIKSCKCNVDSAINSKLAAYVTLSDFNAFKDGLGNTYYTKTEVDATLAAALANTYDKATIDALLAEYAKKADLPVVYTKDEIDAMKAALENDLKALINSKASMDQIIAELSNSESLLTTALTNYFIGNTDIANYIKQLIADNAPKGITEDEVKNLIAQALVEVNSNISTAKTIAENALAQAEANKNDIVNIKNDITSLQSFYNTLNTDVTNLTNNVNNLATQVSGIDGRVTLLEASVTNIQSDITTINSAIEGINTTISGLQTSVQNLNNSIIDLGTKVNAAQATADEAKAQAIANSALITALQNNYAELSEKIDGLQMDVTTLRVLIDDANEDIDALAERVAADEAAANEFHLQMLETISGLASAIDENTTNLGQLKTQFAAFQVEVNAALVELQNSINANTQAIEKLLGTFKNTMAKFISGIVLNGTVNPMFGEFALPVGMRSNVLVAFHGFLDDNGIEFPTTASRFYALPDKQEWKLITAEDIAMIGSLRSVPGYIQLDGNQEIVATQDADGNVKEGNAGTLYLTVNPTNRDFTGTQFSVINSQNEESSVLLSDITKSSHMLTWGYTRAGGPADQTSNGFYEAKATFTLAAVNSHTERPNVNLGELKDVVKDLRNIKNDFNLSNLANAIYDNISQVLQAKAVKATWADELGQYSVVSPYDLAVTTIKPLSFGWAKDVTYEDVVKMNRIEDFIDNIVGKVFDCFPDIQLDRFKVENIELDELTDNFEATFHLYLGTRFIESAGPRTVSIPLPTITLHGDNGEEYKIENASPNVTVEIADNDMEIYVYFDMSKVLEHLGNYCSEPVENVKKQINDFLDDVNKFLDEITSINTDNMQTKVTDKLVNYISDFLNRFKRFLIPNNYMQTVMLAKTVDGYKRLSEIEKYPSHVNGPQLILAPTSFNAEILAPAFKKFVAVTNVSKNGVSAKGGDADCKAELDRFNSQDRMKQVIDGYMDDFFHIQGKEGYTYELLYTAVDYHGLVTAQKYYFTVE